MEFSESEIKDIENILKKHNYDPFKNKRITKLKKLDIYSKKNKLILKLPKISINNYQEEKNNIKYNKIILNRNTISTSSKRDNSINNSLLIESQKSIDKNENNKLNHITIESYDNNNKKDRSLIVKNFFNQIRRKSKSIIKSPNTDLKVYGELFPGPGYYNPSINNIGKKYNLRYQNLFLDDSIPRRKAKNSISNIGPGSYDPIYNIKNKSYSQNPNIFISSLGRSNFINEHEINKNIGPGSYEVSSSFDKKNIRCIANFNSVKKEKDNEKLYKYLQNELNMRNNTNFFNLEKMHRKDTNNINIKNNYQINEQNDIENNNNFFIKKGKLNSIQVHQNNLIENIDLDINNSKKIYTNDNIKHNKEIFKIIKRK